MAEVKFPATQVQRMEEIRGLHLDALDETLDDLSDDISAISRKAIASIKKSGYKPEVIRREARKVANASNGLTAAYLATAIKQAATMADSSRDTTKSPTFRKGKAGSWRDEFTPELIDLFRGLDDGYMERAGYEWD